MNANINNFLLASFLFIVYFCIVISFIYPSTKDAVVKTQTIPQLLVLTESLSEPITFSTFSQPVPLYITYTVPEISHPPIPVLEEIITSELQDQLPIQHLEEHIEVEPVKTIPLSTPLDEITIEVQPTQTIPTNLQVQDITSRRVQSIDDQKDVEDLINLLKKRDTLKLFSPLQIKRQVNKVEKNLATTKQEILTLYMENPIEVISVLKTHLPELFV